MSFIKGFKKVSADEKSTVFQHDNGHKLVIAHNALSPKFKKKLHELPQHLADGGEVSGDKKDESFLAKAGKYLGEAEAYGIGKAKEALIDPAVNAYKAVSGGLGEIGSGFASGMNPPPPEQFGPSVPNQAGGPSTASISPEALAPTSMGQSPVINPDPMGMDAYAKSMMGAIGEQKAGFQQEAAAQAQLGAQQAEAEKGQQQFAAKAQQDYQKHYQDLQTEYQHVLHDVKNQHINPNHYMESMSGGKKVATAIGLILGGMGGGLTGQENPAAKFLHQQINNDIEAQKSNLGKSETLLSANLRQFGNLHDATQMTFAMQNGIYASKLKQAAAQAMDPLAKARALQMAGQLDMQSAPILQQLAMKKAVMGGMNGISDPAQKIRFGTMAGIIPKEETEHLYKELGEAQELVKSRDMVLSGIDQVAKLNTLGNRLMNPIQSRQQIAAIKEPIVAALSKATAGRFTEQDSKMLDSIFSGISSDPKTIEVMKRQADKLISEKMNFPRLKAYNIDPFQAQKYGEGGQKKIQLVRPVR